ncbi:MAG: hypothetical protein WCF85_20375 [Rhodospirillaceae bacterium]
MTSVFFTDWDDIRDSAVSALKSANTEAGLRVFSPMDWPLWQGDYPVIVVRTPSEHGESAGRFLPPTFNTVIDLEIVVQVSEATESAADVKARALSKQILKSIVRNSQFIRENGIQHFAHMAKRLEFRADQKMHLCDVTINLGCEVSQFYEAALDAAGAGVGGLPTISEISLSVRSPNAAASPVAVVVCQSPPETA